MEGNPLLILLWGIIILIYSIPGLAVSIRRLHDINKSGLNLLWNIIPYLGGFYVLFLTIKRGDTGRNKYGSVPTDENTDMSGEIKDFVENKIFNTDGKRESKSYTDIADEIKKYKELLNSEAITEEEFKKVKNKLLNTSITKNVGVRKSRIKEKNKMNDELGELKDMEKADETKVENFEYTIERDKIEITGYNGYPKHLIIPSEIEGKPVTSIGKQAFWDKNLTTVKIPDSVISIDFGGFRLNKLTTVEISSSCSYRNGSFDSDVTIRKRKN